MQVNNFTTRKDLETAVQLEKPDVIEGTVSELQSLHLRHGQSVHGVAVIATDHKDNKRQPNTAFRGVATMSKINGQVINTKIKK